MNGFLLECHAHACANGINKALHLNMYYLLVGYYRILKLDFCADRTAAFPALWVSVALIHGIGVQASHHVGGCSGRLYTRVAVGQTCLARITWFRARSIAADEVAGIAILPPGEQSGPRSYMYVRDS